MLRSEKVQECVRKYTEEMLYDGRIDAEGIDAGAVSLMTKIGRTNVSKELNSLWKNGQLIKFQGRPVFFLDYLTIKKEYPAQYIPLLIPQGSKISDYLKADGQKEKPDHPFQRRKRLFLPRHRIIDFDFPYHLSFLHLVFQNV